MSLQNKSDLEFALSPKNRQQFFDDAKPALMAINKENIPLCSIQLTYLGRNNLDEIGGDQHKHGCVLSFKLSHCIGDGSSGYQYMKYLSDLMTKYDINKIDNNIHQITMQELNGELPSLFNINMDKLKQYTSKWKNEQEFEQYFKSKMDDESNPYTKYWTSTGLKSKLLII